MNSQLQKFSLLLVDDEAPMLRLLGETFAEEKYRIHTADSGQAALALIKSARVDAALVDLVMPEMDGIALLKELRHLRPEIMVIMLTGRGEIRDAVAAIRLGALDFLEKPFSADRLRVRVAQLCSLWELKAENRRLKEQAKKRFDYPDLVGDSSAMLKLKEMIARVGPTDATILIQGETGTGKELVARAIHIHSSRSKKPFVPVDCGAISETVIESELFGHTRGAFTGAHTDTLGLIRSAGGGTLFLDEIGELSPAMQVKLLRVIQEKEVRPVGDSNSYPVDVRILAATHHELAEEVARQNFREDLFYRLNVLTLNVPPLRDRMEDIPLLARHFLKHLATVGSPVTDVSPEVLVCFENHRWPGNVRELENVIRRAIALGGRDTVLAEDLPPNFFATSAPASQRLFRPADDSLAAWEMAAIVNALTKSRKNRSRAAKILSIGEATLYRKIKKYRIQN